MKNFGGKFFSILWVAFAALIFLLPGRSFAALSISLLPSKNAVVTGETFDITLNIDTEADAVNAVQCTIDFPTDLVEGLQPNPSGSSFPMVAQSSPTGYVAGAYNAGVSGKGQVTTLRFKAKNIGVATIKVKDFIARGGPEAALIGNIPEQSIDITITAEEVKAPAATTTTQTPKLPTVVPQPSKPASEVEVPSESIGSEQQVTGLIGAQPEDYPSSQTEIKGTASSTNLNKYSFIPSILLLLLVVWLGIKLFFTEKKRHFELEKAFETELSALSTLESKMDILAVKDEESKDQYLQEFEKVKADLKSQSSGK